jgi:hypothetical protein
MARTSADFATAIQKLGFKIVPNNLFLGVKNSTERLAGVVQR